MQVRGTSETEHPTLVPYLDHLNKLNINYFSSWRNLTIFWVLNDTKVLLFIRYGNGFVVI